MNSWKFQKPLLRILNLRFTYSRCISDVQKKIQQSYYSMHGDLLLSSSTIWKTLENSTDQCGDRTLFISANQNISKTYTEFTKEASKLASGLVSCGLNKGDRIAVCAPNCYEWPLIQFATAKAGLILVNINPALRTKEIDYCLKKVDCKAIITLDSFKTQDFYEILCNIAPELPKSSPGQLQSKSIPTLEKVIMISENKEDGVLNFNDLLDLRNKESDEYLNSIAKAIQFDDAINVQFTSGTTGFPKGATLSHHNVINNALVSGRRLGYNLLQPNVCCQVPLFHCFGCVLATLGTVLFQGTCVFPTSGFNAKDSLSAVETYKCTGIYGTPTMYVDLVANVTENMNLRSLKQAVVGGAPISGTLVKEMKKTLSLQHINIAYGSTENSPAVAINGINDDFENAVHGIVQPLEFVELKVIDKNGALVPVNTEGELCARGHVLFMGYWNGEKETKEVVDKTNWYHTGDLSVMNEYGYIQIVGRKKDMIIRGGENVYPLEIENFLSTHPAILEVQVVGVPDARMGEEICAWITVKKDMNLTEQEIRDFCKGKISHYKIPRYIMFVEEFPKTVSGKIKKFEIKKISIEKLNL